MIRVIVIICCASVCIGLETTDVCLFEIKTISCSTDSVVYIDSARVGRMRAGNCVRIDFGFVGCSVDVRQRLERKCSGRRSCLLRHDPVLDRLDNKCPRDLMTYLEISHHCIQVKTPPRNADSSKCDGNIYPVGMATPNGYLARVVTIETGIGSSTCPWSIEARSGQTIRLTLYDFGLWQDSVATSTLGPGVRPTCKVYATISERTGTASAMILCGGVKDLQRQTDGGRLVYTSNSSSVQVAVTTTNNPMLEQFLLKYEVVGCADPDPPLPLVHVERSFDRLIVKCIKDNYNDGDPEAKAWTIQCLDNGNWSIPLSQINCSKPAGRESEPICEERMPAEYNGILGEGSIVQMKCSLNFRGSLTPTMEWRQHGGSGKIDDQDIATIVVLSIVIVALVIAFCIVIGRKSKTCAAKESVQQPEETTSESRSNNKYYEVNVFDQSTTASLL